MHEVWRPNSIYIAPFGDGAFFLCFFNHIWIKFHILAYETKMKKETVYILLSHNLIIEADRLEEQIQAFTSKLKIYKYIKPPYSYQAFARKINDAGYSELENYRVLTLKLNP